MIKWNYTKTYCINCKMITIMVFNQFNNKLLCCSCSKISKKEIKKWRFKV